MPGDATPGPRAGRGGDARRNASNAGSLAYGASIRRAMSASASW
jgi:hypothetical protein